MSYSKNLAVAQAYAQTAALGSAPAATPVAAAPASPVPAVETPAPDKVPDITPPSVASESTTPAPAPAIDAPSARQTIASFAKDVLARLTTAGENSSATYSLRWKVEFLMTAISTAAVTPAEQASTGALGQALDSATSQAA